jgi:RNA polymerase sigma factor (TIGR02999 family)
VNRSSARSKRKSSLTNWLNELNAVIDEASTPFWRRSLTCLRCRGTSFQRPEDSTVWRTGGESDNGCSLSDVTRILDSIEQGDPKAADKLLPLVYEELRKLAASRMANEPPNQTLQPTALVHEAWLRLVGGSNPNFSGKAHFFGAAAEAMRRILIEKARRKRAQRHGGDRQRVDLESIDVARLGDDDQLLAVNEALDKLSAIHGVQAEVVKLRCFVGMTNVEAAQALGLSERTAKYYWTHARAWLIHEIKSAE